MSSGEVHFLTQHVKSAENSTLTCSQKCAILKQSRIGSRTGIGEIVPKKKGNADANFYVLMANQQVNCQTHLEINYTSQFYRSLERADLSQ